MFLIHLTYVKPIAEIDAHLQEHVEWLDRQFREGLLICSGRKNPRTGGVILAKTRDRAQVDELIAADPFHRHGLATYEVIEFSATKADPQFAALIGL